MKINTKINWKVLGSRLGFGILAAAVTALAGGHVPVTTGAAVALVGGGVATALPGALQASGIVRAASPGETSLMTDLVQAGAKIVSAPKAQRQQAVSDAVSAAVPQIAVAVAQALNLTGQFNTSDLSQAVPAGSVPTPPAVAEDDHVAVARMEAEGGVAPGV